jgi:hypothetical protein
LPFISVFEVAIKNVDKSKKCGLKIVLAPDTENPYANVKPAVFLLASH